MTRHVGKPFSQASYFTSSIELPETDETGLCPTGLLEVVALTNGRTDGATSWITRRVTLSKIFCKKILTHAVGVFVSHLRSLDGFQLL